MQYISVDLMVFVLCEAETRAGEGGSAGEGAGYPICTTREAWRRKENMQRHAVVTEHQSSESHLNMGLRRKWVQG